MKPKAISKVAILGILALVVASLLLALFVICPIAVGSGTRPREVGAIAL